MEESVRELERYSPVNVQCFCSQTHRLLLLSYSNPRILQLPSKTDARLPLDHLGAQDLRGL